MDTQGAMAAADGDGSNEAFSCPQSAEEAAARGWTTDGEFIERTANNDDGNE